MLDNLSIDRTLESVKVHRCSVLSRDFGDGRAVPHILSALLGLSGAFDTLLNHLDDPRSVCGLQYIKMDTAIPPRYRRILKKASLL